MKAVFYRNWYKDWVADIIREIWTERLYDPYQKRDAVVMDCGANIGLFTLYAYEFASKVYSIEPSKDHFETLTKMLTFNEMLDKVVPLNYAISGENGKTKLFHSDNTTAYSLNSLVTNGKTEDFEEVETKTLKTIFDENKIEHIDLVKMDIEGEEMKIFASSEFDSIAPLIDCIVVEWHDWTLANPHLLISSLTDRGYKVKKLETRAHVFAATK